MPTVQLRRRVQEGQSAILHLQPSRFPHWHVPGPEDRSVPKVRMRSHADRPGDQGTPIPSHPLWVRIVSYSRHVHPTDVTGISLTNRWSGTWRAALHQAPHLVAIPERNNMVTSARNYFKHDVLDDGSVVIVRAICPTDRQSLIEAFSCLDVDSVRSRFFRDRKSLSPEELEYFTDVDFVNHVAIGVGLLGQEQMLPIGVGRYIVDIEEPESAEIALTVHEMYRGIGVGTLMFKHLREIAAANDIEKFRAVILETNGRMMHVLQRSQLPLCVISADDVMEISIDITRPLTTTE